MLQTQSQLGTTQTDFAAHARTASLRVRRAFSGLVAATSMDPGSPRTLARELGIDKTLAWKVTRIVTDTDPLIATAVLPGRTAQRLVLDAFTRVGASDALVNEARLAMDEFEVMVKEHADDRETFEMMLSGLAESGQGERELAHRKIAFQGNSATWGVQARVRFCTYIVAPSGEPGVGDTAVIGGLVDLRRLRRNISWTVGTVYSVDTDGKPTGERQIVPLDPGLADFNSAPLLREFCSERLPPIQRSIGPDGVTRYQVADGEVGNAGLITCVTGWTHRGSSNRWRSQHESHGEYSVGVTTPAETLQLDLFAHREFWPELNAEMFVFSLLPGEVIYSPNLSKRGRMPVCERVVRLKDNPLDVPVFDIPQYARMIETAMGRMGHRASDFIAYRVRMKYPILSSSVAIRFDLPEKTRG